MDRQNDLRLKTFLKIERAHSGNQIPDLSIYKVNFVFQLIDFLLVYHGQSQPWVFFFVFFFPIFFPIGVASWTIVWLPFS